MLFFLVLELCILVDGCPLFHVSPEDGNSIFLRNDIYLQVHKA